jgi:ATP-binding cassette subfamily B protein
VLRSRNTEVTPLAYKDALKCCIPFLRDVWSSSSHFTAIVAGLRAFSAILPIAMLAIAGALIDVINQAQHTHIFTPKLWSLISIEAAAAVAYGVSSSLTSHYDRLLGDIFSATMSLKLIARCNILDLETFESPAFQDRLQRARTQISSQLSLLRNIFQAMELLVGLMCILVGSLFAAPGLLAIQFGATVPIIVAQSYYSRKEYLREKERTPRRRFLDYILGLGASPGAVKEIKTFNSGSYIYDTYQSTAEQYRKEDAVLSKQLTVAILILSFLATLIYYFNYLILVHRAITGVMSIGQLIFVTGILIRFRSQVLAFLGSLSQGFDKLFYVADVTEFFQPECPSVLRENPASIPQSTGTGKSGIEFANVSFTYRGSHREALHNVSFSISQGEIIALVGENGAGKSTIAKLMMRLYEPSSGTISYAGNNIQTYSLDSYRQLITTVFQDFVKYDLSVSLNIGLGNIRILEDPERIIDAAQRSGVASLIEGLPKQYAQVLGRRFADGVDLSGGQWQRLALARAFVRDAKIVILDEATASIDAKTETAIYRDVLKMVEGKATVLICHRLSTARLANRIIVLKDAQIIEEGTHDELMLAGGSYAEMFVLQARGYR